MILTVKIKPKIHVAQHEAGLFRSAVTLSPVLCLSIVRFWLLIKTVGTFCVFLFTKVDFTLKHHVSHVKFHNVYRASYPVLKSLRTVIRNASSILIQKHFSVLEDECLFIQDPIIGGI